MLDRSWLAKFKFTVVNVIYQGTIRLRVLRIIVNNGKHERIWS